MPLPVAFVTNACAIVKKAFRLLYPFGLDVGGHEIQRVREASRKGPLLLLPNHKSYLDFLIVSYICFQYKLPLPHVVSGDNLNFPLVRCIFIYDILF